MWTKPILSALRLAKSHTCHMLTVVKWVASEAPGGHWHFQVILKLLHLFEVHIILWSSCSESQRARFHFLFLSGLLLGAAQHEPVRRDHWVRQTVVLVSEAMTQKLLPALAFKKILSPGLICASSLFAICIQVNTGGCLCKL